MDWFSTRDFTAVVPASKLGKAGPEYLKKATNLHLVRQMSFLAVKPAFGVHIAHL